ncbi:hypothetical protein [Zobellella sp. DQSA1]|uniref:hypothetical protein n=1 Tax=Zobellella sp. DQSA1 TaxID=3342386 RepID=UPI0035C08139
MNQSLGQQLYHAYGLKQGYCIPMADVSSEKREAWSKAFSKVNLRGDTSKFKDSGVFLVLSQECDIACRDDLLDSSVELVACKKIKEKTVYPGNLFVSSVRKFQFQIGSDWYEANVEYILNVEKSEILEVLSEAGEGILKKPNDIYMASVPMWRANRYMRSALPDEFNDVLNPALKEHMPIIDDSARHDNGSYIKAIYVLVESGEISGCYEFEFFALLDSSASNEVLSKVQDDMEALCDSISSSQGFFDKSDIYADRETSIFVSFLIRFVRLNVDTYSLSKGEDEFGLQV